MAVDLAQPILGPFRIGQRNDGVRLLQERLNEVLAGTPGFVRLGHDGAFGHRTRAAVVRFQLARRLRADGIVGPITAQALGFTRYTSLQRLGAGAMQLASAVSGSLARLLPSPHAEADPAYDILMALAVQAEVMRGLVMAVPAAAAARRELDQIVASLKRQLESMRNQAFVVGAAMGMVDALQVLQRLLALSRHLHALARRPGGTPGSSSAGALLELLAMQSQMLAAQASALMGLQNMTLQRQLEAANKVLEIAARVVHGANRLVPRL